MYFVSHLWQPLWDGKGPNPYCHPPPSSPATDIAEIVLTSMQRDQDYPSNRANITASFMASVYK